MTDALFLAFLLATTGALALMTRRYLPARLWSGLSAGLAVWLVYVGVLSRLGLVSNAALRPPGIVYIVVPAILFVFLAAAGSLAGGRIARALPLWLPIGFQVYRVGVEVFLHQLWRKGLVPRMLTFEGANVDIWIGASAPVVAWLCTRSRSGARVALAWNVLGLLALANIVIRSALTAPGPLNLIHAEVANRAIGTFPFTYIAGFFAPLAAALHVLSLRALAARRSTADIPKGLPA